MQKALLLCSSFIIRISSSLEPTRIPCILDMALSGLRARRVRMVLNAWIPPAPSSEAVKLINDTYSRWVSQEEEERRKREREREEVECE